MTVDEYEQHRDDNDGYCTECKEWTADNCEPDARNYECPECGEPTVYGSEESLIMELIVID